MSVKKVTKQKDPHNQVGMTVAATSSSEPNFSPYHTPGWSVPLEPNGCLQANRRFLCRPFALTATFCSRHTEFSVQITTFPIIPTTVFMIRIATRQSPLALWQAEHVAALLRDNGLDSILVPLVSGGDVDMTPIDGSRQVGVFTKRIQQALLDDEADVAVHSLKDLPTETDERLILAATPDRECVFDALVSTSGIAFADLPQNATIGTGSKRRAAQMLSLRPDLNVLPIRGNVQTRLSKLDEGEFDAIVLAEAGILRLRMADLPRRQFSLDDMLPAPGQGALGIEVRADDGASADAVAVLDQPATRIAVTAERLLLASLHGGCLAPIAAYAIANEDELKMTAVVLSPDGQSRIDHADSVRLNESDPAAVLASRISQFMIGKGAIEMMRPK